MAARMPRSASVLAPSLLLCSALLAALVSVQQLFFHTVDETAWVPTPGATSGSAVSADAEASTSSSIGRRLIFQESAVAAAAVFWASSPDAAMAFRTDRLLNAKAKWVPKIRAYYQKLEGLRDDLALDVELETGDANTRLQYEARPAEWYSGLDSSLDGPLVLPSTDATGCEPYQVEPGSVVLLARGKCSFAVKAKMAKAAGAKSMLVYDEKMSKQSQELESKTGAVRSKGIEIRTAGDALTGGTYLLPFERGMTIMGFDEGVEKPTFDGAMISRTNGTEIVEAIKAGRKPRVLDVKRAQFGAGIDRFVKKDLPKMLDAMEVYSNSMRISKDDMQDPILGVLKKDREAFKEAVKAKDYGAIQKTFAAWNGHLDPLGAWTLWEAV